MMDCIDVQKRVAKKFCTICSGKLKKRTVEGVPRLVCCSCKIITYENPIPVVAVIVPRKNNEILLIKRAIEPKKGCWGLPTGFIEKQESPWISAKRELKEETGLDGRVKKLVGVYSESSARYGRVVVIIYEMQAGGVLKEKTREAMQTKYFSMDKLPCLTFTSHSKGIKDYMKMMKG
jgi:ADP-ribose pyrophosphatase YjhB (NUDIX family)